MAMESGFPGKNGKRVRSNSPTARLKWFDLFGLLLGRRLLLFGCCFFFLGRLVF